VICFGYPLHPPGRPGQRRDRHLPAVACPLLLVHGTRDPFGSPEEMKELERWLPHVTLWLVEGGDHSLAVPARQDPDRQAVARALDGVADWIRGNSRRHPESKPL
jgi:predicted alpha/beta-hydrolase family hydrolase